MRFGVGVAFSELGLGRENLLQFVVGNAHRKTKFFEMQLGKNAIVVFADEHPDWRIVLRRIQDMLRHDHVPTQLTEIGRFVFTSLHLHHEIPMKLDDIEE